MSATVQDIPIGLANSVCNYFVLDHSPIDEKVLQVRLRPRKCRQSNPASQRQTVSDPVNHHTLMRKSVTTDPNNAPLQILLGRTRGQPMGHLTVMRQHEADIGSGERSPLNHLLNARKFRSLSF
jgi:hypothetical protein